WQFERVKVCQAQQGEAPNFLNVKRETKVNIKLIRLFNKLENVRNEQGKRPRPIGQLKPTIILYGDSHPKGLEISLIAANDQDKADCLTIMGTSLRIPRIKAFIKEFARAVHGCKAYNVHYYKIIVSSHTVTGYWFKEVVYQIFSKNIAIKCCENVEREVNDFRTKQTESKHFILVSGWKWNLKRIAKVEFTSSSHHPINVRKRIQESEKRLRFAKHVK
ncbi:7846_t:CDS:2, partial [Dentiscutata heterogama]